ncbi:MAG: flippase [Patescibacteria group bacterium]|jgi:O-antigen/teichoic acid export membrane protein
MSLARALAFNTGIQVAGKIVSTVLGVLVVGLMTRHLGQEGFGMYSTANAFLQFFAIMLDLGLNVMVVQLLGEHAGDKEYEDRAVSATFTLRTLSALVFLGIAPIIALAFPYPWELKVAIFALWASFFTTALNQIIIGVQQRHLKMGVVAAGEIVGRLVLLIGVLAAGFLGWGLVPIVLIVSIGSTVNFFINFFIARRYASFRWNIDFPFWKTLLGRSWPIGLSILFNLIYFKADTLILSLVRPQNEVGIYGAAYRVLEILVTVPFMYAGVLLPVIAKAWVTGQRERFGKLLGHSFDAMTLLAAPLVAGTFVVATHAMILVAGEDFAESGDILRILILAVGMIFFGTISSYAIVALDAQRKMLWIYFGTAVLALIGYALFIPTYGIWAAAWLTVFSEFCVAFGATAMSLKLSGTRWNPIVSLKALVAAAGMGLVIWPLRNMFLLIPVVLGAVVYVGLVFITGAVSKATLKELLPTRHPDAVPPEPPLA